MSEHEKYRKRIVVKYGGSSLADHDRVLKAVSAVAKEVKKGSRIAVVVSAMGRTTDNLLTTAEKASNGRLNRVELDDILSMGERTSVRLFSAALKSINIESRYFDPLDDDWPIITDGSFNDANPILTECEERIRRSVQPLIDREVVPVIAGFLGRTNDGRVTTLGRGGSETTAFILAKAMRADEVVLVTDADGIMSADPKIIDNPTLLPEIEVSTLVGLSDSGSKFIHTKALRYKDPFIDARVISHRSGSLNEKGTLIKGGLSSELNVDVASPFPAASIIIVGLGIAENPAILQQLTQTVRAHSSQLGLSCNHNSIILYVSEQGSLASLLREIHENVLRHRESVAMSVRRRLATLRIGGVGLEETPGLVGRVSEALRVSGMNIFGMLTIASSIILFVDWDKRNVALDLIKRSLERDLR
jgi:aspartate kinase